MSNDNKKGRKAKETDYNNIFAVRLRELIKATGKKQQEIADNIGISRQALNKWVNGETVPDIFSAAKIADLFNVSTDYLTGRTGTKSVNPEIQAACEVTGLSEHTLRHLAMLANDDTTDNDKEVLENFICSIHVYILFLLEKYNQIKAKREIFTEVVVLKFCEENNIQISKKDLLERGEKIFNINCGLFDTSEAVKYQMKFSKYKNEILDKMDSAIIKFDNDLNEDAEYLKYKLSCELNETIIEQSEWSLYVNEEHAKKLFDYYYKALSFDWNNSEYANFVIENREKFL